MPMNMSYCQFQNTLAALRECVESLQEGRHLGRPGEQDEDQPAESLSAKELESARSLVSLCADIAEDFGGDF